MEVGLIGFGIGCSNHQLRLADDLGAAAAQHQLSLLSGGFTGVFQSAFNSCTSSGGNMRFIVEEHRSSEVPATLSPLVSFVSDAATKHVLLAQQSAGAFLIGGGPGSRKIIDQLIELQKPVVAFIGTDGLADDPKLIQVLHRVHTVNEGINTLYSLLS